MTDTGNPQDASSADTTTHNFPLALPAPSDASDAQKLQLGSETITKMSFDTLGPMVVNSDGTLSRITNWQNMVPLERERTMRVLNARNRLRFTNSGRQRTTEHIEGRNSATRRGYLSVAGAALFMTLRIVACFALVKLCVMHRVLGSSCRGELYHVQYSFNCALAKLAEHNTVCKARNPRSAEHFDSQLVAFTVTTLMALAIIRGFPTPRRLYHLLFTILKSKPRPPQTVSVKPHPAMLFNSPLRSTKARLIPVDLIPVDRFVQGLNDENGNWAVNISTNVPPSGIILHLLSIPYIFTSGSPWRSVGMMRPFVLMGVQSGIILIEKSWTAGTSSRGI